jgi:hypothetical protein
MMINPSRRQLRQYRTGFVDMGLAGAVMIAADRVGICNEELITDQRHAVRRV